MSDREMQTADGTHHGTDSSATEAYTAVMEQMQHNMADDGTHHGTDSSAMEAYMAVMEQMQHNMADVEMTGNPDVDFALAMIPHHQGAIDMAQVVLEYGTDPQIHELAENIIESQGEEISFLNNWLESHSHSLEV